MQGRVGARSPTILGDHIGLHVSARMMSCWSHPGLDAFAGVRSPRRVLLNRRPEVARGLQSAGCRLCACLVSHAWHRRSACAVRGVFAFWVRGAL